MCPADALDELVLDVEKMQQVEYLLERREHVERISRREPLIAKPIEIPAQPSVIGAVCAHFERVGCECHVVWTVLFEALEVGEPSVDPPRRQQRLGERLVGGGMSRNPR